MFHTPGIDPNILHSWGVFVAGLFAVAPFRLAYELSSGANCY